MSKLKILVAPDDRLKKVSQEVKKIGKETVSFINDMVETMYERNGIGLAAPQVGVLNRILVMDCSNSENQNKLKKIINPKILSYGEEMKEFEEGCLSLPMHFAKVTRPNKIKVEYLNIKGMAIIEDFEGIEATCLQHEIDHLDGKLFIDHISKLRKNIIIKKLKKFKKINKY